MMNFMHSELNDFFEGYIGTQDNPPPPFKKQNIYISFACYVFAADSSLCPSTN